MKKKNNEFVVWLADEDKLTFNGVHYTCTGPCPIDCEMLKECRQFGGGNNKPTISEKRVKIIKDTHAELFI